MKLSQIFSIFFILTALGMGCKGNGENEVSKPPVVKQSSYGVFRNLKSSIPLAPLAQATSINQSLTMSFPREGHKAIMLDDGRVMLIGGEIIDSATLPDYSIADFFDPQTERFTPSSTHAFLFHRYTTMSQFAIVNITDGIYKGKVLLAGSTIKPTGNGIFEFYDPSTDSYIMPDQPIYPSIYNTPASDGWSFDAGFYLGNDKVLLCGSHSYQDYTAKSFVILDMTTMIVSDVPNSPNKTWAEYIKLPNGNILGIGGYDNKTAISLIGLDDSIYQFNVTDFSVSKIGHMNTSRAAFGLSILDGTKLGIYGGVIKYENGVSIKTATTEVYDLATNISTNSTNLLYERCFQSSVFLQNQFVLNAGGVDKDGNSVDTELVQNPFTGESGITGKLITARRFYSAVTLNNGMILISGGEGTWVNSQLNTAEIYDPQSKLVLSYPTDHVAVNETLQFSSSYAGGVNWSCTSGIINSTGLFTASDSNGIATVKAEAKDNPGVFVEVVISVE